MIKGNSVIALVLCIIVGQLTWSYAQTKNRGGLTGQDYAEIQQLYARYNFAVDAIDGEGVAAVYTPDGIFMEGKNRQFRGHDASVNWVNTEVKTNHAIDHRRHWNTNLMITGTPEGAKAAVYLLTINVGVNPPAILAAGRYEDALVKTPQGWRFRTRMVQGDRDGQPAAPPAKPPQ
jgi:ketosteroid isomerase-like protein